MNTKPQNNNMSNHTSGKWEVASYSTNVPGIPIYAGGKKKNIIAWVDFDRGPDGEETTANARLIAAAPELLEMLKRMVDPSKTVPDFEEVKSLISKIEQP